MRRGGFKRVWLTALAGAVALAAFGGAAVAFGLPDWLTGIIAAVAALVAGITTERVFDARSEQTAALEGRRRVLDPLRPSQATPANPVATLANVLALLRADRSPMPFRARTRELRELADWRSVQDANPVFLLSGPAGIGKTRLAIEFGSRVPEGWAVGWLHAGAGAEAIAAVAAAEEPVLILVDDADGRTDLIPLLNSLAEHNQEPVIRVLLITRSAEGLRASLAARVEERHCEIVSGTTALELGPAGRLDDEVRWYGEAVRAFATVLGKPVPPLPEHVPQPRAAATEPFVITQARALLAVLGREGGDPDPLRLSWEQVAEELMHHEKRRWDATAQDWGIGGREAEALRNHAIAALALLGADDNAEAAQTLRRVPELRDASEERRHAIASWIASLYPSASGLTPRIRPDVVGEWFVVSQLTTSPALLRGLQADLTEKQASQALGLLARAADWLVSAASLFGEFAGGDVRRQVLASVQAALTGATGRGLLDAVVAGHLSSSGVWTLDQLEGLQRQIPKLMLLHTSTMISELIVTICRRFATDSPDAHNPGLAAALDNLGVDLHRLGRHREALDATTEAVTLHRALAAANPDAHNPRLANALTNLGVQLAQLGRDREALDATTEAVTLHRALAAANPDAHNPGLAVALGNLSIRLDRLGRFREELDATTEAITLYRPLTAANPDAHNPGLADALDSLGVCLRELGRHREALDAITEAITLYRALTAANPDAHNPNLAGTLTNLGVQLAQLGRDREALDATTEAVTLYRALAAANPDAHNPGLATALNSLGIRLARLGRDHDALDATTEAVTLHRALAAANPDAHNPGLAAALNSLGVRLARLGRHREALDATTEATTLYHALTADNPDAHGPNFTAALRNLSTWLDRLGRHQEALEVQAEAVRIYRDLAERDPDLYGAEYRRLDAALRREYAQRGMEEQAVAPDITTPTDNQAAS